MIFKNALKTPDGTILESQSQHDFKTHKDKNGKTYMVDGGTSYLRRSANGDEIDMSIESTDDHHFNRQHFTWGTYGKEGKGPLRRIILADMETDHIEAILKTQSHSSREVLDLFHAEIELRKELK